MDYHILEKHVEEYVTGLFEQMHSPTLAFHDIGHTKKVVKRSKEIGSHYNLTTKEMFVLVTAAWFHDTGYLFTEPKNHENVSCEVIKRFMHDHIQDEELIAEIEGCIMATKLPANPKNLLEKIICDADTYQLGTKEFKESNKKVMEELRLRNGDVDIERFREDTIRFFKTHEYFTSYAKGLLDGRKAKNLKKIEEKKEKVEEKKNDEKTENEALHSGEDEESEDEKTDPVDLSGVHKDKSGLMGKGIQTMLRLTSSNHLRLSELADRKANILISVNSIIISVILSVLLRKLSEETYLVIPTIIFLLVAVTTIVISILATRPKISGGSFTMEEVKAKKTNLLFFGNFYKATYDQYNEAMRNMMLDTDYLYGSLIKDIYYLGAVLGRKYRLIRLAYNIFMIGIVVSVLAFAIAAFFNHETSGTVINGTGSPL
jgi:HD superfamily phosphodiesterase